MIDPPLAKREIARSCWKWFELMRTVLEEKVQRRKGYVPTS